MRKVACYDPECALVCQPETASKTTIDHNFSMNIINLIASDIFRSRKSVFSRLSPQDCALCSSSTPSVVCADCDASLPRSGQSVCPRCAVELNTGESNEELCGSCLVYSPHFDHTITAFRYDFPVDRLLQAYKFQAQLAFTHFLADALVKRVRDNRSLTLAALPDLILPTPLAAKRLAVRGFNQSALLGRAVGSLMGIGFSAEALKRVRETIPQSGLKRDERLKNVRGAFACGIDLEGKRVAIVDDVMTTGATLSEAAKALKENGAVYVEAWACARTAHHEL